MSRRGPSGGARYSASSAAARWATRCRTRCAPSARSWPGRPRSGPWKTRPDGRAPTAVDLHEILARGRVKVLQSTEMAERVYAAVGFRDLGRILEYVPVEGQR